MVGVGNLARALIRYRGFQQQGFRLAALCDNDPAKIGEKIEGLTVQPLSELAAIVRSTGAELGIVTVPSEAAQAVADRDAVLESLARLLARLGGVEDRRFVGPEGPIIELTIPREAYPDFLRELAALGRWQLLREAPALPEKVRVVLRITG